MSEAMAPATEPESSSNAPPTEQPVKQEAQSSPDAAQYAEFLQWKEQQEKAKKAEEAKGDRNPGSPKKAKMDDAQLNIFKLQLDELDLQWDEMEPALRDTLRLNEKARENFLAIHKRAHLLIQRRVVLQRKRRKPASETLKSSKKPPPRWQL
eukprot:s4848_g2.t1